MSGIIKALTKDISDKIAAGEVVERPLSIVKELVENSVDAGASSITVEIKKGGKEYIRVTDDGSGIDREDLELAFKRYATSKISEAEDLSRIESLGFRGEALASIAAVTRVELITRTADSRVGSRVLVSGGEIEDISETACEAGTTIVVRDLFYNTPVRRKFLKPDNSESSLVNDFVSKMAIAYPGIRIRLINNGSILFSTLGKGDLKQAILTVYSPGMVKKLLPLNSGDGDLSVKGYISAPTESRTSRRYQIFFVNGRLVRSRVLESAVFRAYSDKLFEGRHPMVFMFLSAPPESLDVNIHPSKTEIRFLDEEKVSEFVIRAVRRALLAPEALELGEEDVKADPAPEKPKTEGEAAFTRGNVLGDKPFINGMSHGPIGPLGPIKPGLPPIDDPYFREKKRREAIEAAQKAMAGKKAPSFSLKDVLEDNEAKPVGGENEEQQAIFSDLRKLRDTEPVRPAFPISPEEQSFAKELGVQEEIRPFGVKDGFLFGSLEYIGSCFNTYLICRDGDWLYLLDQHAAHERIMFEELKARLERGEADSQMLMIPEIVDLTPADKEAALDLLPALSSLGYEIEDFGPAELAVKGIPSFMSPGQSESFIEEFFDEGGFKTVKGEIMKEELAMRACKAAVKGGDELSESEARALLSQLDDCENPFSCPHGRPTFIRLSKGELEKLFRRK